MTDDRPCACGSGRPAADCCLPFHRGERSPVTAEALMRSRYSAYVAGDVDYVRATWHPSTRPAELTLPAVHWLGLEITDRQRGGPDDDQGRVAFVARFRDENGVETALREDSRFVREDGRWYYVDGRTVPVSTAKVGRNDPCPCGSGNKYKRCCGR